MRMAKYILAAACFLTMACPPAAKADPPFAILGKQPAHIRIISTPPNAAAVGMAVWAPGIDDGYVPQGLTVAGDSVLVAGYKSTLTAVDRGPCRIFRINARTGAYDGHFDLPSESGHAGGLAYIGEDVLVVSDTRMLFKIAMKKAFADGNAREALLGVTSLGGELRGSSLGFDGKNLFVCRYAKQEQTSRGWYLPLDVFGSRDEPKYVTEADAKGSFPVTVRSQGAAFDAGGNLWMTQSGSAFGRLQKMDPATGRVIASYEMVKGVEDIGFDAKGHVWAVSEAGCLRWSDWGVYFPVVFSMDPEKLEPETKR